MEEKTIVEIYDTILRQDDLFGIKEVIRSESYRCTGNLMNYMGAYRDLVAEYTQRFGYDTFNEFLDRCMSITAEEKEPETEEDTQQIDFGSVAEAMTAFSE